MWLQVIEVPKNKFFQHHRSDIPATRGRHEIVLVIFPVEKHDEIDWLAFDFSALHHTTGSKQSAAGQAGTQCNILNVTTANTTMTSNEQLMSLKSTLLRKLLQSVLTVSERVTTRSKIVDMIGFVREKFVQNMARIVKYTDFARCVVSLLGTPVQRWTINWSTDFDFDKSTKSYSSADRES